MVGRHNSLIVAGARSRRAPTVRAHGVRLDSELLTPVALASICRSGLPFSAGLSLSVPGGAVQTISAIDDVVVRVDWLQHELGQGPGVGLAGSPVMVCKDLGVHRRWPDFGRMCVAVLGLRSMVNVAVPVHGMRAMLNWVSAEPDAFDHLDVHAAQLLAQRVGRTISSVVDFVGYTRTGRVGGDFNKMAVALAIVMARYRVGAADGFVLLHSTAVHLRVPLYRLAVDVVRHGALPTDEDENSGPLPPLGSVSGTDLRIGGPDMWRDPPTQPTVPHGQDDPQRVGTSRVAPQNKNRRREHVRRSACPA